MTDHQKLIEELEAGVVWHLGDNDVNIDATEVLLTRAAQAIRSLEGEVFRLSQSQPISVSNDGMQAPRSGGKGG